MGGAPHRFLSRPLQQHFHARGPTSWHAFLIPRLFRHVRTCATLDELNRMPPGPKVVLATSTSLQVRAELLRQLSMPLCLSSVDVAYAWDSPHLTIASNSWPHRSVKILHISAMVASRLESPVTPR